MNFQMFNLDLEKAEEPEIKLPTSAGSSKKQESFRKTFYFCFIDYAKAFDCVDHNKLWQILEETVIPDHLICLLRNLCAGQEAKLELDMEQWTGSKLGKEYIKAVYCYPAYLTSFFFFLFNFYAEHNMWNARPDEEQVEIKTARRNINNLRYTGDTTLMADIEKQLKSLLMKVKEESEKVDLKLEIPREHFMQRWAQ